MPITVEHLPFDDIEALEAAIDGDTAAVFIEPIQGEAGIFPASNDYLQAIRRLTSAHGALMVADEIQTGFRTGVPFAITCGGRHSRHHLHGQSRRKRFSDRSHRRYRIDRRSDAIRRPRHDVRGEPTCLPRGNCHAWSTPQTRSLRKFDPHRRSIDRGIERINSPKIRQVRGRGLMIGVELKERVTPTLRALQERGVLVLPASPVVFRLLPPSDLGSGAGG